MAQDRGPSGPLDQEWGCDESRVDAHPAPQDIVTKGAREGVLPGPGPEGIVVKGWGYADFRELF